MANTEGIPDEHLHDLLTIDADESGSGDRRHRHNQTSFLQRQPSPQDNPSIAWKGSRGLTERQRMMNEFQSGGDMQPSAKVIRTGGKRPIVKSAGNSMTGTSASAGVDRRSLIGDLSNANQGNIISSKKGNLKPKYTTTGSGPIDSDNSTPVVGKNASAMDEINIMEKQTPQQGMILSESVMERPVSAPKKISKFKMRQQQKLSAMESGTGTGTKGGFPSFDIPVGMLTRKGNKTMTQTHQNQGVQKKVSSHPPKLQQQSTKLPHDDGNGGAAFAPNSCEADAMLANMSKEEIAESVAEIEGILSAETINFLRKRHKEKKMRQGVASKDGYGTNVSDSNDPKKSVSFKVEQQAAVQEKEDAAKMLSGIKTEEELVEAFAKSVGLNGENIEETSEEEETELESASKLLRSTSKRQRLLGAKRTCEWLDERLKILTHDGRDPSWVEDKSANKYSDILPVALRCLLDVPSPQKNFQLIEYVIRSIHSLTILFTPAEHRLDFNAIFEKDYDDDADVIFQQEYMQDAVPIPSASKCYMKRNQQSKMERSSLGDGCYATNASAESAKSDGKEFYSDPGWILLSKMKFIPCISNILIALTRQSRDEIPLSLAKIIRGICGILAQMSLRSPGAAVAIAQHSDIVPKLISLSLEPGNPGEDGFVVDTKTALPVIYLFCILSRQSRSAAKSLETIVETTTSIVASNSEVDEEVLLQRWCIIFWRTLLRYGLGISHLSIMLQLSIVHLASDPNQRGCLAPEYLSAFAIICECVKITSMHKGFKEPTNSKTLTESDRETLAMSGMWFSSHVTNCADDIIKGIDGVDIGDRMKIASTKIRFISLYYDASSPSNILGRTPNSGNIAFVPIISIETYIAVLDSIFDSQLMNDAINIIMNNDEGTPMRLQARACSFIEACYYALRVLIEKTDPHGHVQEEEKISSTIQTETQLLRYKVFERVKGYLENEPKRLKKGIEKLSQATWMNGAHFAVATFLSSDFPAYVSSILNPNSIKEILPLIQSFICHLIGRLGVGEEKRAALLFSQDIIFTIVKGNGTSISVSNMAGMQDVMMRELCTSPLAQSQLDHSFKISGRPGLTVKGKGHFSLESLRSETDYRESPSKTDEPEDKKDSDQFTLPIGEDWAWKLLSSTITMDPKTSPNAEVYLKATDAIISSMEYLHYIATSGMRYNEAIEAGAKMYFLLNTCFYPETIIRDEKFEALFMKLFFEFRREVLEEEMCDRGKSSFISFIITCNQHSRDNQSNKIESTEHDKLVELLFDQESGANDDIGNLSSKDLKAVDTFVDDISTAFIDFGAQYDSFIYAIRYLLMPGMPNRVRIRVLDKLKDLLHLLTTESEHSDLSRNNLGKELGHFFLGGFSPIDKSGRDSSGYLDKLASLLGDESFTILGRQKGFFYCYAVGCLARSLASSSVKCECGVKAMRRRVKNMAACIYGDLIACSLAIASEACKNSKELANVIIDVCFKESTTNNPPDDFEDAIKSIKNLSGQRA